MAMWVYDATPAQEAASNFPAIISVSVVFWVVMLTAVSTRAILRRQILGLDDALITLAAVLSSIYVIMTIIQTRYGLGLPLVLRPEMTRHHFSVLSYAGKPFYWLALGGYRLALCAGYLRFIDGSNMRNYRIAIKVLAGIILAATTAFALVTMLECSPPKKAINPLIPGHCLDFLWTQYTIVAISIALDVAVFMLPIPLFMKLSVHRKAMLGLSILFACGLITTVCAIWRATYLHEVGPKGSGNNSMVVLFGVVETNVGIVMSCLPFLRTFFKSVFSRGRTNYGFRGYPHGSAGGGGVWGGSAQNTVSTVGRHVKMSRFGGERNSTSLTSKSEKTRSDSPSGSQEAILFDDEHSHIAFPEQGIVKTTAYHVREERIGRYSMDVTGKVHGT